MGRKAQWHDGPPPSLGWWPASVSQNEGYYRWWDGNQWSFAAVPGASRQKVIQSASIKADNWSQKTIRWTRRPKGWPARSKT
jgi:hypothetical protein